jgi:hypothetical protein
MIASSSQDSLDAPAVNPSTPEENYPGLDVLEGEMPRASTISHPQPAHSSDLHDMDNSSA